MSFVFPIADALRKIDRAYKSPSGPSWPGPVAEAGGGVPKSFLPVVKQTVDIIAGMYLHMLYGETWGVVPGPDRPLDVARAGAKRVLEVTGRTAAACLSKFSGLAKVDGGYYSTVFTGQKRSNKYAIKRVSLDPELYKDIGADSVRRELEITEQMGNLGVGPKLFDSFVCGPAGGQHLYLVLEWFNRRSLWDYLESGARLTEADTASISELISKMHESGVIHADLHSGNILVHEGPRGGLRFAVADFGRAHRTEESREIEMAADRLQSFSSSMRSVHGSVTRVVWGLVSEGEISIDIDVPSGAGVNGGVIGRSTKRVSTSSRRRASRSGSARRP